jgi:pimeloyl-ACP methyl ester carboxylesterase
MRPALASLRFAGRAVLDAVGGLVGRDPLLVPLAGEPGTVTSLTTPDSLTGAEALNPDNTYPQWQQEVAARSALRAGFYRPGRFASRVGCPLLVLAYLNDVTLVGNDTGGALVQLLACDGATRVSRIVLVSCDAFDNFPPGLTGKTLVLTGKLPPTLFGLFMQQMRLRPLRRLPLAFGWLTMRGDAATARWINPVCKHREIRRDTVRVLRGIAAERHLMLDAAACLTSFERPALVVWASQDRVMPPQHGRRLAELLPQGRLVEIPDSYTLIPLDQPARLAEAIQQFMHESDGGTP